MASGSDDKTVRLWSVSEPQEVAVLTSHTKEITSVTFDGSGKYIASGSADMTVRLWDIHGHTNFACLNGLSSPVTSVGFSPTSALIAAGSHDGCVCLWNTSSAAVISKYTGCIRAAIRCLAWSADEVLVAVGSCDGSISLNEASSGLQSAVMQCPEVADVSGITLSCDALLLAAAVTSTARVHVFDVASALLLASCELRGSVGQLMWSVHGVLSDGQGNLWSLP